MPHLTRPNSRSLLSGQAGGVAAGSRGGSPIAGGVAAAAAVGTQAECRVDALTGNSIIFAPGRAARPDDFVDMPVPVKPSLDCPFCAGNEHITPTPVWIGRLSDETDETDEIALEPTERWNVRVVPNKFPAVGTLEAQPMRPAPSHAPNLLARSPIAGGHEVIIDSRRHVRSVSQLETAELELLFEAYRDRIWHWRSIASIRSINVFKNVGRRAGASLLHAHSQLIAANHLPPATQAMVERQQRYHAKTGCNLHCDLLRAELKERSRIVYRNNDLIAYCPFASSVPYHLRITTAEHASFFEDLPTATVHDIGRLVGRAVSWLESIHAAAAYNLCLITRPPAMEGRDEAFQWYIDLIPRLTNQAGFEWSTATFINPTLPEDAAADFRRAAAAEDPRTL